MSYDEVVSRAAFVEHVDSVERLAELVRLKMIDGPLVSVSVWEVSDGQFEARPDYRPSAARALERPRADGPDAAIEALLASWAELPQPLRWVKASRVRPAGI